jgi:2-hydroxymuconate-semialdehyde hydrolase
MRGEFIDVGGRRLYYYAAGSRGGGPPVVLIHGFPTSSHLWGEVVPLLPAGHRVVVLDLLGYGRSDPPGDADLSLHAHARRTVALMDQLGIRTATVVGHHLGGGVAQAMAVGWPGRVAALGLLHSIGCDVVATGRLALARAVPSLVRLLPGRATRAWVKREMEGWYDDAYRARHSPEQYLRPFLGSGSRALVRHLLALDAAEAEGLTASLSGVRVPAVVVGGTDDPVLPGWVARQLQAAIPGATLDFVQGARHYSPEEAPERLAKILDRIVCGATREASSASPGAHSG